MVNRKKHIIKIILVIIWMIVIFMFSNQNAQDSSDYNRFLVDLLKNLGLDLDKLIGENINYYIRKLAHMVEYGILALLIYNVGKEKYLTLKACLISIGIVFIYAVTDEVHQYFIPGRACAFSDMLIDTMGGVMGLFILFMVKHVRRRFVK